MTLFSKRYERALFDKRLVVGTVPSRARQRVWMAMELFNAWWDTTDATNWWQSQTSTVDEQSGC